jgi:hypothetical protein
MIACKASASRAAPGQEGARWAFAAALGVASIVGGAGCSAEQAPPRAIIDAETGQLYGASREGRWVAAEKLAPAAVDGAELVHYGKDGQRGATAVLLSVPTVETCSNPTYRPQTASAGAGTYLAADWDAAPRRATLLSADNPTYRAALAEWLLAQGIHDADPTLSQLVRVDLDGDGQDEILLAAERRRGSITSTRAGDYSVLLLRRLQGERVVTTALRANLYAEDCIAECAPTSFRLFSTLDLDADGRLELIITTEDYEARGRAIYGLDDLTQPHLAWHCGP